MSSPMLDPLTDQPPKLIDLLEREFLPKFTTPTAYQYRHAVKKMAISLGYQPTPRDLRAQVVDWVENWLTNLGHSRTTVNCTIHRIRAICHWYAMRQLEGRKHT